MTNNFMKQFVLQKNRSLE